MSSDALKILVTGGGGFLGSHVIRHLLHIQTRWETKIFAASRQPGSHPDQEATVEYLSCDITDEVQVAELFHKVNPKVVIHTTSPDPLAGRGIQEAVNVNGTKHILRAAAQCAATRVFVFTASDSGLVPNQEPISEEQAILYDANNYSNPYGMTKGIAEAMVIAANGPDLLTTALRVPGMYGDFDYNGMLPALLSAIKKGEQKVQIGSNQSVFEVLCVRKAAEAHILAAQKLLAEDSGLPKTHSVAGKAFFISDGITVPYWDFFRKCYAAGGAPVNKEDVRIIPLGVAQAMASTLEWGYALFTFRSRKPGMRRQNMDHFSRGCNWKLDKAKDCLGYVPLTQSEQDTEIKRMLDWGLANIQT